MFPTVPSLCYFGQEVSSSLSLDPHIVNNVLERSMQHFGGAFMDTEVNFKELCKMALLCQCFFRKCLDDGLLAQPVTLRDVGRLTDLILFFSGSNYVTKGRWSHLRLFLVCLVDFFDFTCNASLVFFSLKRVSFFPRVGTSCQHHQ